MKKGVEMLGLMGTGWSGLLARLKAARRGKAAGERDGGESTEISERIRARYDTARKRPPAPSRQWLREHGVLDDWEDAWRVLDR